MTPRKEKAESQARALAWLAENLRAGQCIFCDVDYSRESKRVKVRIVAPPRGDGRSSGHLYGPGKESLPQAPQYEVAEITGDVALALGMTMTRDRSAISLGGSGYCPATHVADALAAKLGIPLRCVR